jgi:hypothetical protein
MTQLEAANSLDKQKERKTKRYRDLKIGEIKPASPGIKK